MVLVVLHSFCAISFVIFYIALCIYYILTSVASVNNCIRIEILLMANGVGVDPDFA